MARVSRDRVVVQDNVFISDDVEQAEKLRDPTHVRCYSEDEWRGFFVDAGLEVVGVRTFERRVEVEPWLARSRRRTTTPRASARSSPSTSTTGASRSARSC